MKKLCSLIKATLSSDMSLFKFKSKKDNKTSKTGFVIVITLLLFFSIYSYADMFMEPLSKVHLEYVLLTLFILITAVMTLIEGIYKASSLIFNCKDDNLLLSLPIKKSTVLFIRIFKFYLFELLYNSVFLAPAMLVYTRYVNVGFSYYLVSVIALFLLPIIPIILSCLIGGFISNTSSRFKFKNIAQIILITIFLLIMLYVSFNLRNIMNSLATNASSINEIITKIYYPAGAYINLVTNFNILELLIFILIHIALFVVMIVILSNVYFKINSRVKEVSIVNNSSNYKIKVHTKTGSLIKKEFNKFINSPVFVTNAAFGLVLHVAACIIICFKFNDLESMLVQGKIPLTIDQLKAYIPIVSFGLICFASLMSSITSSMISLEGKSFIILKSLPINPSRIILSKILTAIIIMVPFILIGNIILIIKFNFSIIEIFLILLSSIVIPLVAETIGILINLKYPKMEFENDTEVVKQSISTTIAVFIGMFLTALSVYLLIKGVILNINVDLILFIGLSIYTLILVLLLIYMNKKSVKEFNEITI